MGDKQASANPTIDLQKASIPVRADCGHIFPVPVPRLVDGQEFSCPECGQVDRIDDEALADARTQLAARDDQGSRDLLSKLVEAATAVRSKGSSN